MRSVVVLGGGIVGLTMARELRGRGVEVELLESRRIGTGATAASTGILTPPQHTRTPFYQLRTLAWHSWPQFADDLAIETGIDVGYRRCGGIDIRERTMRNPQREVRKLRNSGGRVEVLTGAEIRQLLPQMVRTPEAGLRVEMEARIDPLATIEALRQSCLASGVRIREDLGSGISMSGALQFSRVIGPVTATSSQKDVPRALPICGVAQTSIIVWIDDTESAAVTRSPATKGPFTATWLGPPTPIANTTESHGPETKASQSISALPGTELRVSDSMSA